MDDRRSVSNLLIDAHAQVRFLIPFFFLLITSLSLTIYLYWHISELQAVYAQAFGTQNLIVAAHANDLVRHAYIGGMVGIALMSALSIIFWLVYTHRIFGPEVPMLRHIRNMIDGKYDGRIQLRKNDEHQAIASELNRLAETLSKEQGFSLIETLIAVAIGAIGLMAMTSLMSMSNRQQSQSNLTFHADNMRRSLVSALNNADGWKNTYKDSSNNQASGTQLDCLISPAYLPCTTDESTDVASGGTPLGGVSGNLINKIFDASGALVHDSSAPDKGTSLQGTPCTGFIAPPAAGNDRCPLRFEVRWKPRCKCSNSGCAPAVASDTCRNPQVQLKVNAIYNASSKDARLAFNPDNYSTPEFLQGQVPGGIQSANNTSEDGNLPLTSTGTQNKFVTNNVTLSKGIYSVDFYNCLDSASAQYFQQYSAEAVSGSIAAGQINFQQAQLRYYNSTNFIMKILSDTAVVRFYVQHMQGGTITYGAFPCSAFNYTKIGI